MKQKYYAVAKGKTPGIYLTWEDCKAQVEHVPGAVYKSFSSVTEAEAFLCGNRSGYVQNLQSESISDNGEANAPVSTRETLVAYVDGSYDHSKLSYAYGCALVLEDEVISLNGSGNDIDYIGMRNVAGEILGSEKAIEWAISHGYKAVHIYYDYEGIEKWANGSWRANKIGTQAYKSFVEEKRQEIEIVFHKVAAHTGVEYNELADQLAKEALGL